MARPGTPSGATPEFISNETVGAHVAVFIELGVTAFEAQAGERGPSPFDAGVLRAGKRAVHQLRELHGTSGTAA